MSIDNVQDITPRSQYTLTAGQTVIPYPFPIFDQDDIVLDIDGVIKTITTHYTVSGVGADNGGNVTLVVAAAGGETATVYRDTTIERTSDLQQNGPIRSSTYNDDMDRLHLILQELTLSDQRSIRVSQNDEVDFDDLELPAASSRASRFLVFDANGGVTTSAGTGADSGLRSDIASGATAAKIRRDNVAALTTLTGMSNDALAETLGYYTDNDGGHGSYRYDSTSTATVNGGTVINAAGGVGRWLLEHHGVIDIRQFGAKLDGTNDSAAFLSALQTTVINEIRGVGILSLTSVVSATLTSDKKLSGDLTIKWAGSATSGAMVTVNCAGFDFEYDIKSDGNDLISAGWLIENSTAMSGALPQCIFKGKTTKFRATAAAAFNNSAYIRGSFRLVQVSDGDHSATSRAAGLGAATQTIVVDMKTTSLYPRVVKHFNNTYSAIACDDTGAADIDTDYFVCTMPDPTNFPNGDGTNGYPDIEVESYGNTYRNPIGRSEKFQCVPNTHNNTVIRNGDAGSRAMNTGSVDFNLQWGVGECRDQKIYLKGDTTSPIVAGYTPVSFFQGTAYTERRGSVLCRDIAVYNQIDSALADNLTTLVGLQINATSATKAFSLVEIKNIVLVGGTADHAVIMAYDTGGVGSVVVDNVQADFNFNPIAIQTACPSVRLVATNIVNTNATSRLLINDVGGGNRSFTGTSFGYNYIGITQLYEFGATFGPASQLAGAALCDQLANQNSGGCLSVQSKFMADDATYTFGKRGFTVGNHIIFVAINFGAATSLAIYACIGASGALTAMSANALTDFATGAGSNPDTDTKFNLWVDANGQLNAKNRLGSSRSVTIAFLG